jgi:hypothetical protein
MAIPSLCSRVDFVSARYNISTGDFNPWMVDAAYNAPRMPIRPSTQDFIGLGVNVSGPLQLALHSGASLLSTAFKNR